MKEGPDKKIYPLRESQLEELTTYKKKFKCINPDQLKIWGDYNSRRA